VLGRLVDAGNTVIVIEHNLDVIKTADWILDLGPEGGPGGGRLVAAGTPEQVARTRGSHTGRYLLQALRRSRSARPQAAQRARKAEGRAVSPEGERRRAPAEQAEGRAVSPEGERRRAPAEQAEGRAARQGRAEIGQSGERSRTASPR
jgi:excinuclease ABC subunit A